MSKWNFELFNNFKEAARQLNLEVESGWNYYSIKFDNKDIYAYCWTPLNKMRGLGELTPDEALRHIKDNQDDFHLEFDTRNFSATMVFAEMFHKDYSLPTIKKALILLQDIDALQKRVFLTNIKYAEEQ